MERVDRAEAYVRAAPDAVFAALTEGEARASWLPPSGMKGSCEWFDARVGGGYRMVLTYDDPSQRGKSASNQDVVEVRFLALERPNRVVEAVDFVSDDDRLAGTMTLTWTVEPHAHGSLVTITATDVPPGIEQGIHEQAFASSLTNLAAHLRQE